MGKKRFNELQIIEILKESAAGMRTAELCRKYGIATETFYRWRRTMKISDSKRLKALQEENAMLKKLLVEKLLEHASLKDKLERNF